MVMLRKRSFMSRVLAHSTKPGLRAVALTAGLAGFAAFSLAQEPPKPRIGVQVKAPQLVDDEEVLSPAEKVARELDAKIIAEENKSSEIMANLQYISDVIGPRLTGSANLKRANEYAAEKMKSYGLENVHLEPWSIPVGWERGTATLKVTEPENGKSLTVASYAWAPGTKGKLEGDVVVVQANTAKELEAYKGKLKNAIVLRSQPSNVRPITESGPNPYGGAPGGGRRGGRRGAGDPAAPGALGTPPGAGAPGVAPPAPPPGNPPVAAATPPGGQPPAARAGGAARGGGRRGGFNRGGPMAAEIGQLLRSEGVACILLDSGKPHGLLNMTGNWRSGTDRTASEPIPQLFVSHDHYAMLYRLATRPNAKTRAEVEITNKFLPGPIAVYNTVGEIKGSEKPDEIVVVGAHLDSWDLGSGTTDNGTGSTVVLETARLLAKCGVKPKRTIRFVLFTGEEEGLHGSREYVKAHKAEMPKTSMALVHDTGTGKVKAIGTQGFNKCTPVLTKELACLKKLGVEINGYGVNGSDHQSFGRAGQDGAVPGFAFQQENAEYNLTHHSQSDTFDKARPEDLKQGAEVMAIAALRVANLPDLLPREPVRAQ
jgi:carboxypeptidase Q